MTIIRPNQNRVLFTKVINTEQTFTYFWYPGLKQFRKKLIRDFPDMAHYFPKKLLKYGAYWPNRVGIQLGNFDANTGGSFISQNLTTPSTVIGEAITPLRLYDELQKGVDEGFPYTHVGFSLFVFGYSKLKKCVEIVKNFDESIITIAGNIGIMEDDVSQYVDYVCHGDGVPFMRNLLGEDINAPYQTELIPATNATKVLGKGMISQMAQLVTKLGCPHNCNFCSTRALFKGKVVPTFVTPKEVHDKMVQYREKIGGDYTVLVCEPQMILRKDWWYELFELFEEEEGDYAMGGPASLVSLKNLDYNRMNRSSLRFMGFNVGIESFIVDYAKNLGHQQSKEIIQNLTDHGIFTYGTLIIGFDEHDYDAAWEEVHQLTQLGLTATYITNLKIIGDETNKTSIKYQMKDRLLDMPVDFHYLPTFQAHTHPHFNPGFVDMLPLIFELNKFFETECGPTVLNLIEIYRNLAKLRPHHREQFEEKAIQLQKLSYALFPSWKKHLHPTETQVQNYLKKLGDIPKVSPLMKLVVGSRSLQKVVGLFSR